MPALGTSDLMALAASRDHAGSRQMFEEFWEVGLVYGVFVLLQGLRISLL